MAERVLRQNNIDYFFKINSIRRIRFVRCVPHTPASKNESKIRWHKRAFKHAWNLLCRVVGRQINLRRVGFQVLIHELQPKIPVGRAVSAVDHQVGQLIANHGAHLIILRVLYAFLAK